MIEVKISLKYRQEERIKQSTCYSMLKEEKKKFTKDTIEL